MALEIRSPRTAHAAGVRFAETVRQFPAVKRLWVWAHRDEVEFWLLTEEIDAETEHALHAAGADLHDWLPGASVQLHLVNPRRFDTEDLTALVPAGAEEIALHAE